MDTRLKTKEYTFNYGAHAVIINANKILLMKEEGDDFFYLPGGRVGISELEDRALLREMREKLKMSVSIIRPIWMIKNFFIVEGGVVNEKCSEQGIYYLVDFPKKKLLKRGDKFKIKKYKEIYDFEWVSFDELQQKNIRPHIIKKRIFEIPEKTIFFLEYEFEK